MQFKYYKRRYIYHYKYKGRGFTQSGIAQLSFRINTHDDLTRFRDVISRQYNENVPAIDGLSYLGRETILNWIKHCLGVIK